MSRFKLKSANEMWKDDIKVIIENHKNIIERGWSQIDGILTIEYAFNDGKYIKIPLQILERFLVVE